MTSEAQNYQGMLHELDTIMREVAQPDIDLDLLVTRVERGYDLILRMRERLQQTKSKVADLHRRFEETMTGDGVGKS